MSEAAIKALTQEIEAVEKAQEPTRLKIAELTMELTSGDETIARNRAAIALLNGDTPLSSPSRPTRRRSAPGAASTTSVSRDRIVDFIGANGPSRAVDIGEAIGTSGNPLTNALKALMEDGVLVKEGVKRGTTYSLRAG